ncbi:MAG: hypothetical protein PHN88_12650 [Ignavibacteria bacterium]|nr:hypothetical protein [Ignavibacteria bacterium]
MKIPIIIFAYNRPDNLSRILDGLKKQDLFKLIFFIDGPKTETDVLNVRETINIAKSVDWCDKDIIIHEKNRGLPGMSHDMDTISDMHEMFAVVEDDCLPMPDFFHYVCESLKYYKDYKNVFAIGGYQPLRTKYFKNYNYSVVSSYRFLCWGWATWSSKWKELKYERDNFEKLFNNLNDIPDIAGIDLIGGALAVKEGRIKTWDIQVSLAMLSQNKVMILPVNGLIKNIGLTKGTHGGGDFHPNHNLNISYANISNFDFIDDVIPGIHNSYLCSMIKKQFNPDIYDKFSIKLNKFFFIVKNQFHYEN